jgi:hypothetical protein
MALPAHGCHLVDCCVYVLPINIESFFSECANSASRESPCIKYDGVCVKKKVNATFGFVISTRVAYIEFADTDSEQDQE